MKALVNGLNTTNDKALLQNILESQSLLLKCNELVDFDNSSEEHTVM